MKAPLPLLRLENHSLPVTPAKRPNRLALIRSYLGIIGLVFCFAALLSAMMGWIETTIIIGLGGALFIAFADEAPSS